VDLGRRHVDPRREERDEPEHGGDEQDASAAAHLEPGKRLEMRLVRNAEVVLDARVVREGELRDVGEGKTARWTSSRLTPGEKLATERTRDEIGHGRCRIAFGSLEVSMSKTIDEARSELCARLGLEKAPHHFDEALRHSSYSNEHRADHLPDNQRLEFLGDAVLDLCVSELLLEKLPDQDEGVLSRAYGALVNGESLARWARENGVGAALQVGKGAATTGISERTNVLADTVEALVAAIYLDGGLPAARAVAALIIEKGLADLAELARRDAKTTLQELLQAGGGAAPAYRLVSVEGPDHDREFLMAVEVGGKQIAEGRGRTKKLAEQAAASAALELVRRGAASLDEGKSS